MKNYKKADLTKLLQENSNQITVSEELKKKTLQQINQSLLPLSWIRNCAAVLLVSCICLSLYIQYPPYSLKKSNNIEINEQNIEPQSQNFSTQDLDTSKKSLRSMPATINSYNGNLESSKPENKVLQKDTTKSILDETNTLKDTKLFNDIILENSTSEEWINEIKIGDTEEKLLQYYPNIKQKENGYQLITENKNIFYHIENSTIINIFYNN